MNLNKVILCGNITRKPELKSLDTGVVVTTLTVAINQVWKDSSGQKKEHTDFLDVTVFGKQAESCAQYLEKGQMVMVEGRLKNRAVEDRGEKRYKTGVLADHVSFGKKIGGETTQSTDSYKTSDSEANKGQTKHVAEIPYPTEEIDPEDIPF